MFDNNVTWQNKLVMFNQHQKGTVELIKVIFDTLRMWYTFKKEIPVSLFKLRLLRFDL